MSNNDERITKRFCNTSEWRNDAKPLLRYYDEKSPVGAFVRNLLDAFENEAKRADAAENQNKLHEGTIEGWINRFRKETKRADEAEQMSKHSFIRDSATCTLCGETVYNSPLPCPDCGGIPDDY